MRFGSGYFRSVFILNPIVGHRRLRRDAPGREACRPQPRAASSVGTIAAMAAHGVPGSFRFGPVSAANLPSAERPKKSSSLKIMLKPFLMIPICANDSLALFVCVIIRTF